MKVYCARHRENEYLTEGEAERLVYGLQAALSDSDTEADEDCRPYAGDDPHEAIYSVCPTEQLGALSDGEMYHEHIDAMVETRRFKPTDSERRA